MLNWGTDLVLYASKFVTIVIKWMKAARNMHCDEVFTFTCQDCGDRQKRHHRKLSRTDRLEERKKRLLLRHPLTVDITIKLKGLKQLLTVKFCKKEVVLRKLCQNTVYAQRLSEISGGYILLIITHIQEKELGSIDQLGRFLSVNFHLIRQISGQ